MLNIPRMKLALPKWIWPDVQRLITSANSVVFKRVLAKKHCMCACMCVCVCACAGVCFTPHTHTKLPVFHSWLNIYKRERHWASQTNTNTQPHTHTHTHTHTPRWTWGRESECKRETDGQREEGGSLLFNVLLGRELSETRRVETCQRLTEQNHHSSSSLQDMDKPNELRSDSSPDSYYSGLWCAGPHICGI